MSYSYFASIHLVRPTTCLLTLVSLVSQAFPVCVEQHSLKSKWFTCSPVYYICKKWKNRFILAEAQRLLLLLKWWFLLRDGNVLLHSSSPVWEHFTAQKYIFSQFLDVGQKTTFQTLKKAEKISCETPFSNSKQGAEDLSHFLGKISACSSSWFFCMVLIAQSSGSSSRITTDLKYRPGFTTLLVIELVSDQNP